MNRSESSISAAIGKALETLGVYTQRLQSGVVNGRGGKVHCCRRGTPDRLVVHNGRTVFVEVKAPGEKAKAHQLAEHERIERAGAVVIVGDDAVDVVRRVMEATK